MEIVLLASAAQKYQAAFSMKSTCTASKGNSIWPLFIFFNIPADIEQVF